MAVLMNISEYRGKVTTNISTVTKLDIVQNKPIKIILFKALYGKKRRLLIRYMCCWHFKMLRVMCNGILNQYIMNELL